MARSRVPAWLIASLAASGATGAKATDMALGEYLSAKCVTCHQLSGASIGGIPPIVGLPEDHLVEALRAYQNGGRNNEVMRSITIRLTSEEIAALAAYFAAQTPRY